MQDMAGPMNGGAPMDGDFGDPYGDSNGSLPPVGDGAPPDHFDADGMNDGFVEEKIGGLPGDPEADLQPGSEEQAGAEGDQSPGASSTSSASSRTRHRRRRKKKRRATTGGSYISDDIDPYYDTDRRHSYNYGSRYPPPGQNYIIPPVQHMSQVNEDYVATTPISLYGPNEYRRRLEEKRRTRRQSLIQPAMEFDPTTGRYIEPAGRFNARTQQMLPGLQEEDVDDADMQVQLRAADPRFRQDGFANRTKVWKRLQGGDPGMIL